MKTILYADYDRMEVSERDIPEIAPHEVLLKVDACGICGSELEGVRHKSPRRKPPLVLGHEFCGTIAKVGSQVKGWQVGQKVVANALVTCDDCPRCRKGRSQLCAGRQVFGMNRLGAWSEYVNVPARVLFHWPENLGAEAACLAEPLGNGIHAVELIRDQAPKQVMVIGAGPIGLLCQQAAQVMLGVETFVVDRIPERIEVAKRLGAKEVFNASTEDVAAKILERTEGEGIDAVIDAAGVGATKRLSLASLRPGGTTVWVGIGENEVTLPSFDITLGERRVLGMYAARTEDMQKGLDMMSAGQVDVTSWTHQFPLEEGAEAFWRMMRAQGNDIKAVLRP